MIFKDYAQYYDIFYGKKDYGNECHYLEQVFHQFLLRLPKTLLDLGCGTGNHAICLAKNGYKVTGVDGSASMLAIAREKCGQQGYKIGFHESRLQNFKIARKFDVALSMFSVMDYLIKEADLLAALKNIRKHLKINSLFIFDFWNKEAVLRYYSPTKRKVFYHRGLTIERTSQTTLLPNRDLCRVHYHCRILRGKHLLSSIKETHTVRYFSISQMSDLLKKSGFKVLNIHPFMNPKGKIRKNTWDVTAVCQNRV